MKRMVWMGMVWICIAALTGCRTGGGDGLSTLDITLLGSGKIEVLGRIDSVEHVGRAVRRAGARRATTIEVAIHDGFPQTEMARLTGLLRKAGFSRVVFTRPRKVQIVKEPAPRR